MTLSSLSPFSCVAEPPRCWRVSTPMASCCSESFIHFQFEFHFQLHFFCFSVVLSSSLSNSLCWFSIFLKCHMGLLLKDKEATELHTLLAVHELINHWHILKEVTWFIIDHEVFMLSTGSFVHQRANRVVWVYVEAHSSHTGVTEIWTMLLWGWVI